MFFSIKLILPGPGFKPGTSRIAGRRCPCILSHLTQVKYSDDMIRIEMKYFPYFQDKFIPDKPDVISSGFFPWVGQFSLYKSKLRIKPGFPTRLVSS